MISLANVLEFGAEMIIVVPRAFVTSVDIDSQALGLSRVGMKLTAIQCENLIHREPYKVLLSNMWINGVNLGA